MEFTREYNSEKKVTAYTLTISEKDMAKAEFNGFDRLMLNDIADDPEASISDNLLGLEILARRIEEGQKT